MDMSADDYLSGILTKYHVGSSHVSQMRSILYPHMEAWGSGYLMSMVASGSIAKSTAVATGTDTDYFLSLSSLTPGTLRDIYETLFRKCQELGISPRRQNVSIHVRYNNHSIDLVPGRRQSQYGNDHSLYVSKRDTWTQTNVQTHITVVSHSGRTDEIKLTKIWRDLRSLELPSFYLELAVIDALQYRRQGQLADNFWEVLRFLAEDFVNRTYIDPANSNNRISDDLSTTERRAIASAAAQSRQQRDWADIVW
jgi:hypothetical protein